MSIFKEFFISLAKPGEYKRFLKLSMVRIFTYQLFISVVGFIAILLIELIAQMLIGSLASFGEILEKAVPQYVAINIVYMWMGICVSTVVLSVIFLAIHRMRGNKDNSFKQIYVYTAHALTISALVSTYMGFYGTLVAVAFYYMATKADREEKKFGTIGLKYREGVK